MPAARGRCAGLEQWADAQWRAPARWRAPSRQYRCVPRRADMGPGALPACADPGWGLAVYAALADKSPAVATAAHAGRGGDTGQYWAALCAVRG